MPDQTNPELNPQLRALLYRRAQPGTVVWLAVRPARGAAMVEVADARLITDHGLEGDVSSARSGHKRQVSLIQAEHLPVIAQLLGRDEVRPEWLRRNLVVRGINLLALRHARFRIGECVLEGTGTCDPCSKLERSLGHGGYNAVRGHGGILARVIEGGTVHLGDAVDLVEPDHALQTELF
jgi:MOSC domain-containing protein YiiM